MSVSPALLVDGLDRLASGGLPQALLAGFAASWIALLFHELGHAVAASLLGIRIWGIRLGMGPVVHRGQVGATRLQIGFLPLLGSVQLLDADASSIGYRDLERGQWRFEWGPRAWRATIITAAGSLSNLFGLLLIMSLWESAGHPPFASFSGAVLIASMVANFGGYLNLLPCLHSDGSHLLAHVRAARERDLSALGA